VAERACTERTECIPKGDADLILRVFRIVDEVSVDVMRKRLIPTFILIAYSAILIKLIVFKTQRPIRIKLLHLQLKFTDHGTGHVNFLPFKTIWPYLHGHPNWLIAIVNLVGNMVPFVPMGFLVPFVYRKMTWQKSLVLAAAVGLAMEGLELVFRVGIFDIDDVILNALGVMIGYWVFAVFERRMQTGATPALGTACPGA